MDFLNKTLQQIADLYRQLTPGARIMSGLLVLTIIVSLTLLFRGTTQTADEYLFGGEPIPHRELAMMEAAFAKAGLNGQQIEGNRMKVPRGKKDAYLKALWDHDAMPSSFTSAPSRALTKGTPFDSNKTKDIAMKLAKEEQLAKVISSIVGIDEASVMYDEADTASFPRRKERRATVAVRAKGNRGLTDEEVKTVRHTVMSSISGLKPPDVTVVDMNGGRAYPGGDGINGGGTENIYATTKKMFEREFREKIYNRLTMYPGVIVGVNVELDPDIQHNTATLKFGPKPVPASTTSLESSTPVPSRDSGGRPGAAPNALGNTAAVVNTPAASSDPATVSRSEQRFLNSTEETSTQKAPLVPNRVSATVDVPTSYFAKVWRERNAGDKNAKDKQPDPADLKKIEEETLKNIEAAVVAMLPPAPAEQKAVTVTTFTEIVEPLPSGPSVADKATNWFGSNWQTVAMIGVGLFSLMFLKGALKPPPEPVHAAEAGAAPDLKIAEGTADGEEDEETLRHAAANLGFKLAGPNMREELTELVKTNPDTAANILKNWIGDVA